MYALNNNSARTCEQVLSPNRLKLIFSLTSIVLVLILLPKSVMAQSANSFFFGSSAVTVAPKAELLLKANTGTNQVDFVGASFQIDITKVKVDTTKNLSYPLVLNDSGIKTLFLAVPATDSAYINCSPVGGDSRCTNGLIRFVLAKCPPAAVTTSTFGLTGCFGINNTAQSGTFDLLKIPLISNNNGGGTKTNNTMFQVSGNEFVKSNTNPPADLTPFTSNPATLTIPVRGDSGLFDGVVNAIDLSKWKSSYSQSITTGASGGDFNGDGVVNALDLSIWKANYGK